MLKYDVLKEIFLTALRIFVLNSKQPDQFISSLCQTWVFRLKSLSGARQGGREVICRYV